MRTMGEPRPEFGFSRVETGKYAERFAEGSNIVVLDSDMAKNFATSRSVNRTLGEFGADSKAGVED